MFEINGKKFKYHRKYPKNHSGFSVLSRSDYGGVTLQCNECLCSFIKLEKDINALVCNRCYSKPEFEHLTAYILKEVAPEIYKVPQYSAINCKNKKRLPFDFALFEIIPFSHPLCFIECNESHHFRTKGTIKYKCTENDFLKWEYSFKERIPIIYLNSFYPGDFTRDIKWLKHDITDKLKKSINLIRKANEMDEKRKRRLLYVNFHRQFPGLRYELTDDSYDFRCQTEYQID